MPHPFKRRLYRIMEQGAVGDKTSLLVDQFLIFLIFANVLAVVLETVPELNSAYGHIFRLIELVSVVIFTIEYAVRLWVADLHMPLQSFSPLKARLRYMVSPAALIDLLAILPFFLGLAFESELRLLRIFRLVRFLKLARYSPGIQSLSTALHSERRALLGALIIMSGLALTAATLMYAIEGQIQPDAFGSIPMALWWALSTLTTVGYGDVVPVTPLGKVVGSLFMLFGLGMFALPIGIVATAFAQEIHRKDFVVTWGMVARVPLFQNLSAADIADVVTLLHSQRVHKDGVITRAGDDAHSMYFLTSGRVEVRLPDRTFCLGEGDFFGEVAVLRKARRSATVYALEPTNLLVLDANALHDLMERKPKLAMHIQTVAIQRGQQNKVTPDGDLVSEELESQHDTEKGI